MDKHQQALRERLSGNLRLIEDAVDPRWMDDIHAEVSQYLKCQLTYSKGWPARATQSHKMARFGDPGVNYSFKGIEKPVHAWPGGKNSIIEFYRCKVEELIGWRSNCCVVNTYTEDGDLFPHRDSQYIPELGENPTIVSISFGQTRYFHIWELDKQGKRKPENHIAIRLNPGDILIMENEFDAKYHHGMKPEPESPGLRLSLTYRKHL